MGAATIASHPHRYVRGPERRALLVADDSWKACDDAHGYGRGAQNLAGVPGAEDPGAGRRAARRLAPYRPVWPTALRPHRASARRTASRSERTWLVRQQARPCPYATLGPTRVSHARAVGRRPWRRTLRHGHDRDAATMLRGRLIVEEEPFERGGAEPERTNSSEKVASEDARASEHHESTRRTTVWSVPPTVAR